MQFDNIKCQIINMKPSGIYVHIPFCRKKCLYCDFFSAGSRIAEWKRYAEAVKEELRQRMGELSSHPDTLYIGGGTPSLMPGDVFLDLAGGIRDICGNEGKWKEFTIEVNPEDVTDETSLTWKKTGVNRVSMGVQTFNDGELKKIGRLHDSADAIKAFNILRSRFANVSLDLMFGLPGQTMKSWQKTVGTAISLNPDHVSAYSLMFEERTAMTILRDNGTLTFPKDEESVEMWRYLSDQLKRNGFRQYEISNYAKPGYESVHNSRYWHGNPYLGLGVSAHSYDGDRTRRWNGTDIKAYMDKYSGGGDDCQASSDPSGLVREEVLNDEELREEYIMLRMRTREGIDMEEYRSIYGERALERLIRNSRESVKAGNLVIEEGKMRLTGNGIMLSDEVIVDLMS